MESNCHTNGDALIPESNGLTLQNLWETIISYENKTFYTKKGLPFTYMIKGGEMFTDRRERSITRSTFEKAFCRVQEEPLKIIGPKSLNVYGAPYVWAVLQGIGAVK